VNAHAFAPAKVNLYLHVGHAEASGYHPISSLIVFADVGDRLSASAAEAPEFLVEGPFADALADADPAQNLVVRAVAALEQAIGTSFPPLRLVLTKALPIAAGLGGGSADAGAALRLLTRLFDLPLDEDALAAIAAGIGADGPMCLLSAPCLAEGWGERLSPAPGLPALHAVLVNPGVASPTPEVYRAYDLSGPAAGAQRPALPDGFESAEDLAAILAASTRNDLEAPAVALQPVIGEALDRLRDAPETLLARMSGSGATCFALCAGDIEAAGLAAVLGEQQPRWWVRACRLGGPWPGEADLRR
jgi:4-diphosphocytidyl-2-C-methyl-D-erythritol kinase